MFSPLNFRAENSETRFGNEAKKRLSRLTCYVVGKYFIASIFYSRNKKSLTSYSILIIAYIFEICIDPWCFPVGSTTSKRQNYD